MNNQPSSYHTTASIRSIKSNSSHHHANVNFQQGHTQLCAHRNNCTSCNYQKSLEKCPYHQSDQTRNHSGVDGQTQELNQEQPSHLSIQQQSSCVPFQSQYDQREALTNYQQYYQMGSSSILVQLPYNQPEEQVNGHQDKCVFIQLHSQHVCASMQEQCQELVNRLRQSACFIHRRSELQEQPWQECLNIVRQQQMPCLSVCQHSFENRSSMGPKYSEYSIQRTSDLSVPIADLEIGTQFRGRKRVRICDKVQEFAACPSFHFTQTAASNVLTRRKIIPEVTKRKKKNYKKKHHR